MLRKLVGSKNKVDVKLLKLKLARNESRGIQMDTNIPPVGTQILAKEVI